MLIGITVRKDAKLDEALDTVVSSPTPLMMLYYFYILLNLSPCTLSDILPECLIAPNGNVYGNDNDRWAVFFNYSTNN